VLALAAGLGLQHGAASNSTVPALCTEAEYNSTWGCSDDDPGGDEPSLGIPSEHDGKSGRSDSDIASLFKGLFGGVFCCLVPCCWSCIRRSQHHASSTMPAPSTSRRMNAKVNRKWTTSSCDGEGTSTSYHLTLEFTASDTSNAQLKVGGERMVYHKTTYQQAQEGSGMEVGYKLEDVASFEFTSDLECRLGETPTLSCVLSALFGVLAVLSVAAGVATGPVAEAIWAWARSRSWRWPAQGSIAPSPPWR